MSVKREYTGIKEDVIIPLMLNERSINQEDIDLAEDYLANIPCMDYVSVCGVGIGYSNCPHYHLKLVFKQLVENFKKNK